jgi:Domain of unknown function (DUF4105)
MYFLLIICFAFSASASSLHENPKWLKLLHYKKNLFGLYVSEADGDLFFIHDEGKYNPKAELEKSIVAFAETTIPDDNHPICKFPLRYKWLNQELGMPWKADFKGCSRYLRFFSKLAAKRASLVFSSYYLTNPNSAFGHTLLRLSRYDDPNETEMLDYGINFAAQAQESNPFLYAMKGLFGGFKGDFAALPYYYKVREYSDYESRDLWSFDLKLSMTEVLEMVDHIWELGNTHFDYFYFRENCSYHLLSLLEVVRPTLNLKDKYQLYTIPADTVRLLQQEGLIGNGKLRESTYSRLARFSEGLSAEDLIKAKSVALKPEEARKLRNEPDALRARILDLSIEAFDYYNSKSILRGDLATKKAKSSLLLERANNPVVTTNTLSQASASKDSPAHSHSPSRITLAPSYYDKQGPGMRFEHRAALHDLLDPPRGSLNEAQLELGKLSLEIQQKNYHQSQLVLDQLSLFNIRNYQSQNFWSSPFAWEVDTGARQLRRLNCFNCPAFYLKGSIGNSLDISSGRVLLVLLLNGEADLQSQFQNNYRIGLGPRFVSRFNFSDRWLALLTSSYHLNTYEHQKIFQDYEWLTDLEFRHHLTDRLSLGIKGGSIDRNSDRLLFSEVSFRYFYE